LNDLSAKRTAAMEEIILRSFKTLSITLGLLSFATMPVCFADEASSTTVETNTPIGQASTKVETKSDELGTTTKVRKQATDIYGNTRVHSRTRTAGLDGVTESESRTHVGAGGTASSHSATSTQINSAGGVTQSSRKVQHVSTPLGSSTTIKKETEVNTP